jgi:DNA polymerase-1
MLIPVSGGFEKRAEKEVVEKFGVTPSEMVDYLALIGDASDNIPGVPGIGPKSAAEILHTFGSADKWLDDPAIIDPANKFAKKLLPALEVVRKNRELIRLRTDLPDELNLSAPPVRKEPDWETIRNICEDNQFRSILKELPSKPVVEIPEKDLFAEDDLFAFAAAQNSSKTTDDEPEEIQGELF